MPPSEFWDSIQSLPLSQYIGFSYWFPLLESIHVLAISLVVGSILWVATCGCLVWPPFATRRVG